MNVPQSSRRRAGSFAVVLLLAAAALPASAEQSAFNYALPPGWTSSIDAGVETLTPGSEPEGTVQVLLLPVKPMEQNFEAQFDAERASLESQWGLTAPEPVAPQRGSTSDGPYAAHFASYASDGGVRYMSFLAIGRQGKFAMLVFVAASDDAFNRVAPQVTQFWQSLRLAP